MKYTRLLSFTSALLFAALSVCAQQSMSLNGTWEFELTKGEEEAPQKLSSTIPVPSNWAILGWEEPVYKPFKEKASVGYYAKTFIVPQSFEGQRVLLHFDGVWACAEPCLNGHSLGKHDSGFTSFAYDVSQYLDFKAENRLTVKVTQDSRFLFL